MLIPGCCFQDILFHQVWGTARSAILSMGDLMYESSNLTQRNSDLENMCIYSINLELDTCGAPGWCWEKHTRTNKTLPVSALAGSWGFQGECRVCTALLGYQKTVAKKGNEKRHTWDSAASMLWERFPFCTGSEALLDGVISTSVLVLFGSSIFSVT